MQRQRDYLFVPQPQVMKTAVDLHKARRTNRTPLKIQVGTMSRIRGYTTHKVSRSARGMKETKLRFN